MKTCKECQNTRFKDAPNPDDYFYPDREVCKFCIADQRREYREEKKRKNPAYLLNNWKRVTM